MATEEATNQMIEECARAIAECNIGGEHNLAFILRAWWEPEYPTQEDEELSQVWTEKALRIIARAALSPPTISGGCIYYPQDENCTSCRAEKQTCDNQDSCAHFASVVAQGPRAALKQD